MIERMEEWHGAAGQVAAQHVAGVSLLPSYNGAYNFTLTSNICVQKKVTWNPVKEHFNYASVHIHNPRCFYTLHVADYNILHKSGQDMWCV